MLESAAGIGDIVSALEINLIASELINRNSFGGAETEFLAGLEVRDFFFVCSLNVADDGVGEDDLV